MKECNESILKMLRYHCQHQKLQKNDGPEKDEDDIISIDILVLFGKSYLSPLETYSLRLFMNPNNDDLDDNHSKINDKAMRKIKSVLSRNLQQIDKIWDSNLSLTECKILINVNDDTQGQQYLNDPNFLFKEDLYFRFPSKSKSKSKTTQNGHLYLMNFWNKNTAKKLMKKEANCNGNKNKENVIPSFQIHEIQHLLNNKNNEAEDDRSWFVSKFSFKSIAA